jgi:hypothetical protein
MEALGGLGLKTTVQAGFLIWASTPGARLVRPEGGDGGHVAPLQSLHQGEAKS